MKYNYIFFNSGSSNGYKHDSDSYYYICSLDLAKMEQVQVNPYPLDWAPFVIRFIYKIHMNRHINSYLNLPFKSFWHKYYFKNKFKDNKPLCFVLQGLSLPIEYLEWLKKRYPNSKIVLILRDLISLSIKRNCNFKKAVYNYCDLVMSYDAGDVLKYKIPHFDEFESKIDIPKCENYPECDVFFAGVVKNRLPKLMTIYNILTSSGLKVHYYLIGVPEEIQKPFDGIVYTKKYMTYREMLYHTVNCRCVLDVNQDNALGYTSRFLEAIMYNKLLIADNTYIKTSKFYNPKYIQIYDDWNELDPEFVKKDEKQVDYNYNNEFSPIHLINQIDDELIKRFDL